MWIAKPDTGMRAARRALLLLLGTLTLAQPLAAQRADTLRANARQRPTPAAGGLRVELGFSGLYDSNIGHDEEEIAAVGMITGVEAQYDRRTGGARYALTGALAAHSYTQSDRWDRVSALAAAAAEVALLGPVSAGVLLEGSLGGANEDRVVTDQLMLSPRLYYRFGRGGQLRLLGAYRLRESRSGASSSSRYAGAVLRTGSGSRPYLELSTRFERNEADLETNDFDRQTHGAELWLPLGRTLQFGTGLKYTRQHYTARFIEQDPEDPDEDPITTGQTRRDTKLTPSLELRWDLLRRVRLEAGYEFERRTSTDPGKAYDAHVFELATRYRW